MLFAKENRCAHISWITSVKTARNVHRIHKWKELGIIAENPSTKTFASICVYINKWFHDVSFL
jgi:hypothetical protein